MMTLRSNIKNSWKRQRKRATKEQLEKRSGTRNVKRKFQVQLQESGSVGTRQII